MSIVQAGEALPIVFSETDDVSWIDSRHDAETRWPRTMGLGEADG